MQFPSMYNQFSINKENTFPEFKSSSRIYRRYDPKKFGSQRFRNYRRSGNRLFLKALQDLNLIQADIDFSQLSMMHQETAINQISEQVILIQKETELAKLNNDYEEALQNLQNSYQDKIDEFKMKVDLTNSANENLINEITARAIHAEKEYANLLQIEKDQYKNSIQEPSMSEMATLNKQLREAQTEFSSLHQLKNKAEIAKRHIDEYRKESAVPNAFNSSYQDQQLLQKEKVLSKPSRVADQMRTFEAKKKKRMSLFASSPHY